MPTLGDIAAFVAGELRDADGATEIQDCASLGTADSTQISFFTNSKYFQQALQSNAAVLIVDASTAKKMLGRPLLISKNPYRDFARVVSQWYYHLTLPPVGIHPTAVVSENAVVDKSARVGAFVVIEAGARIGKDVALFPFCFVGTNSKLGASCLIYPRVVLMHEVVLGERVILQAGAVLGGDGFGFAPDPPQAYVKVPHRGRVLIGDDVEIQANACVDRGVLEDTVIEKGAKLDNLVHISHNVHVGAHTVIAAQAGIAGSSSLGQWVTMAGQSAVAGHLHVGDQAIITGQAGAGKDIASGAMVSGTPAQPTTQHHRGLAELNRLPALKQKIKDLETRIVELEKRDNTGKK